MNIFFNYKLSSKRKLTTSHQEHEKEKNTFTLALALIVLSYSSKKNYIITFNINIIVQYRLRFICDTKRIYQFNFRDTTSGSKQGRIERLSR